MHVKPLIFAAILALPMTALAQVSVEGGWVRATVPQQQATGVYMQIKAANNGARLVEARSPVASSTEIHEMKLDGNIMRMRAVPALEIPAGKTVNLESGGYHVMLTGLKKQVKEGDQVPLTLVFEDKDKKRQQVELKVVARGPNYKPSHMPGH